MKSTYVSGVLVCFLVFTGLLFVFPNTAYAGGHGYITEDSEIKGFIDESWHDSRFRFRNRITINKAPFEDDYFIQEVVLIPNNFDVVYPDDTNKNMLFISGDGKTKLQHQIIKWDVENLQITIYVRLPISISTSSRNIFFVYYDPISGSVTEPDSKILETNIQPNSNI